jgi:hypothetical protein
MLPEQLAEGQPALAGVHSKILPNLARRLGPAAP